MSLLKDEYYAEWRASYSKHGMMNEAMARAAFKAAEAAVIVRLATVSVEPLLFYRCNGCDYAYEVEHPSICDCGCFKFTEVLYHTDEALAAARVQAIEEAAKVCESIADEYQRSEGGNYPELKTDAETGAEQCEYAIRELIGGK